jgi:hypothetical protein
MPSYRFQLELLFGCSSQPALYTGSPPCTTSNVTPLGKVSATGRTAKQLASAFLIPAAGRRHAAWFPTSRRRNRKVKFRSAGWARSESGRIHGVPGGRGRARGPARLGTATARCSSNRPDHDWPSGFEASGLGRWTCHNRRLRGLVVDVSTECPFGDIGGASAGRGKRLVAVAAPVP